MATPEEIRSLREEFESLNNALKTLDVQFKEVLSSTIDIDETSKKIAQTYKRDLSNALASQVRNNKEIELLQSKQLNKQQLSSKEQKQLEILQKRVSKDRSIAEEAINGLRREGVDISSSLEVGLQEQLDINQEILQTVQQTNTNQIAQKGIIGNLAESAKIYLTRLDKSGLSAKLLSNEFSGVQKLILASEIALLALIKGTLQASDNIALIAKNTGVSAEEAQRLQTNFALTALESGKLFINSKDLNKAFSELSNQTGLIADFGGETLITQSTLTKQLGLSSVQAGKLSLLSRLQDKNTESVLSNTVKTVGAISKQNGVALNVKNILDEISNISAAITVSLGKNPIALAEAASQAKLFGANLSTVDSIASSLLNFEESISNELQAELLTGQNINLEKARLLALNNDLAGLSQELANNEEIINVFATGNRIQQEAAAAAIGLSRDQLAEIALQQEFNNLSAQQFKDTYGEITYQQLQSQSASEKFASTLEAIQGIIGDISIAFAPFLDGLATSVGFLAKNKIAAAGLVGILTTLASISLANAIANIFASSLLTGPIAGPILAAATVAGLITTIASSKALVTADDMIAPPGYGDRILSTPRGSIALNNNDTVVAGTNLGGENQETKRTNQLLERLLNQPAVFKIGTDEFYTATSKYSYQIQ